MIILPRDSQSLSKEVANDQKDLGVRRARQNLGRTWRIGRDSDGESLFAFVPQNRLLRNPRRPDCQRRGALSRPARKRATFADLQCSLRLDAKREFRFCPTDIRQPLYSHEKAVPKPDRKTSPTPAKARYPVSRDHHVKPGWTSLNVQYEKPTALTSPNVACAERRAIARLVAGGRGS
jgi:hypothetical protein